MSPDVGTMFTYNKDADSFYLVLDHEVLLFITPYQFEYLSVGSSNIRGYYVL